MTEDQKEAALRVIHENAKRLYWTIATNLSDGRPSMLLLENKALDDLEFIDMVIRTWK